MKARAVQPVLAAASILVLCLGADAWAQPAEGKGGKQRGKQQGAAQKGAPAAQQPSQPPAPTMMEIAPRVHAALDQIEKAFQDRDAAAMERLTSEQMVAVVEPADKKGDPTAFDKKTFIGLIKASFGKGAALPEHRFTERMIEPAGQDVLVRTLVVDRWPDGRVQSERGVRVMHPENGEWKVLFAAPEVAPLSVFVRHPLMGSAAQELGIAAGDVVLSYAGVRVLRSNQLQDLVRMNSTSPSAPELALVVRRDGAERTFRARPGMLGVSLEDRLLPDGEGELIGPDRSHPAKDAFVRQMQNAQKCDWAAFAGGCCPKGALVFGRTLAGPVVNARALEQNAEATDFKTVEWFDVHTIVRGGVAVSTARVMFRLRNNEFSFVMLEGIHVRQGAEWPMVSLAAGRIFAGPITKPTAEAAAISGEWEWFNGGERVVMQADGGIYRGGKWAGNWRLLDPAARRYMVCWGQTWFDDFTLSPDGSALTGRNNKNSVVWGKRAMAAGGGK